MSLFGILFVLAVLTAIPTFGLSFVALYFAKRWINSNEGKKVAAAAVNACSSDNIIALSFISAAGAQSFFTTYGTAEKKYHRVGSPAIGYIGYVRVQDDSEYVVMVNNSGATTYVSSFVPPQKFGNDFLSLMAKKEFLDSIVEAMGEAGPASEFAIPDQARLPERSGVRSEIVPSTEYTAETIQAAKSGDAEAQYMLAKMHMSGDGVLKSNARAFDWCLRAARQEKDGDAMFDVAEMYRLGNGTAKNFAEARKWYVAANSWSFDGHPEARDRLGIMYRDGLGVSRDLDYAYELFCHAGFHGSDDAMFNAGMMELSGEGATQNIESAMTWIVQATHGEHQRARQFLAILRELYGEGNEVPQDLGEAFDWYVRAATHGHEKARRLLGRQ